MKFIIIVGLPCSGKTTLAKQLIKGIENSILFDDPMDLNFLDLITTETTVVITSPFLCHITAQNKLKELLSKYPNYDSEWIFFENDLINCLKNAKKVERKVSGFIREASIPVYKG